MKKMIMILLLSVVITTMSVACGERSIVLTETGAADGIADDIVAEPEGESSGEAASMGPGESASLIYVYICGAVKTPGVYTLEQDARIYEAVTLAGGFTEDADPSAVNQAQTVSDGMMVRIPVIGSAEEESASGIILQEEGSALIDLNTADAGTLMTLPGIGEAKAAAIIAYRQENGGFSSIEELKNVSGIGDSTYSRLREQITVNRSGQQ